MRRLHILAIAFLLLGLSTQAATSKGIKKSVPYGQKKTTAYIQGGLALQFPVGELGRVSESDVWFGGSLALGRFIEPWLAIQARGAFIHIDRTETNNALYLVETKLYPLNIRKTRRKSQMIEPYILAGTGGETRFGSGEGTGTSFVFELGAGLDIMLGDRLGLFGQFAWELVTDSPSSDISDASQIGVTTGLIYRF